MDGEAVEETAPRAPLLENLERKERAVADMLRAEKKKVELPLGLSRHVC